MAYHSDTQYFAKADGYWYGFAYGTFEETLRRFRKDTDPSRYSYDIEAAKITCNGIELVRWENTNLNA